MRQEGADDRGPAAGGRLILACLATGSLCQLTAQGLRLLPAV